MTPRTLGPVAGALLALAALGLALRPAPGPSAPPTDPSTSPLPALAGATPAFVAAPAPAEPAPTQSAPAPRAPRPLRWIEVAPLAPAHHAPALGYEGDGRVVDVRPESGRATVFERDAVGGFQLLRARPTGHAGAGLFGEGWLSDLDARLRPLAGAVAVLRVQGLSLFRPLQPGVFVSVWGDVELLRRTDAGFELIDARGELYGFDRDGLLVELPGEVSLARAADALELRGPAGRLTLSLERGRVVRASADGAALSYVYRDATLAQVDGPRPRTYAYEGGELARIEGDAGLTLERDDAGRLTRLAVAGWEQRYRFGPELAQVDTPRGRTSYRLRADGWDVATPQGPRSVRFDARGALVAAPRAGADPWPHALPAGDVARRFDAAGRLAAVEGPGVRETLSWTPAGQLAARTSVDGRASRYAYDDAGRLIATSDPAGTTRYAYDAAGRLLEVTTPAGVRWSTGYRGGAPVRQDGPAGAVSQRWDGARLRARLDASGREARYAYDDAGRLVEVAGVDGARARLDYDARGRLTRFSGALGTTRVSYGEGTTTVHCGPLTLRTTVDAAGDTTRTPFGAFARVRDAAGRLSQLESPAGTFAFGYDAWGARTQLCYPNGVVVRTRRDGLGRALRVRATLGTRTVHEQTTAYDAQHQVAERSVQGRATRYAHDAAGRLCAVDGPGRRVRYAYDPDGNRARVELDGVVRELACDARGRLVADGEDRLGYDPAGRLVDRLRGEALDRFGYDAFGRLAWVERAGAPRVSYGYDALGRIVTRQVGDALERWVYDDARLLAVLGPGDARRVFVYGPELDEPLAYRDGDEGWTYLLHDGLHSSVGYLDEAGALVAEARLGAFGEVLAADLARPVFFAGRLYDPVAQVYPLRARAYDPALGRFLTPDPSGLAGGVNAYAYARNRPLERIDPLGLWDWVPDWARRGGVALAETGADVAASSRAFLGHVQGFGAYLWEDVEEGRARDRIYGAVDAYSSFVTFGLLGTDLTEYADSAEEAARGGAWGERAGWAFALISGRQLIVDGVRAIPRLPGMVVNGARIARTSAPTWVPRALSALRGSPGAARRGLAWVQANRAALGASLLGFLQGQAQGVWNVTGRPFVSAYEAGADLVRGAVNAGREALPGLRGARGQGAVGGGQAAAGGGQAAAEATQVAASQPRIGIRGALEGETPVGGAVARTPHAHRPPGAPAGFQSAHLEPPAWLRQRMDQTVDAVRRGEAGPAATVDDVEDFLSGTYEHANEVAALTRALGGSYRAIPAEGSAAGALRGIHDFGERASTRRVREFLERVQREPLTDRAGQPVPVPAWLERVVVEAEAAGEATVDVGKLSPHVAAGLGRAGPPDPYAIRLHNLSAHHTHTWSANQGPESKAVIEAVADMVSAMRQPRSYRNPPLPMSFPEIREQLGRAIARGDLPPGTEGLVERALTTQARLERTPGSGVNPYYRWEEAAAEAEAASAGIAVRELDRAALSAEDARALAQLERAARERELAALRVDDGLDTVRNNASGESAASLEAISRARENRFLIVDAQGKTVRELIGPDAVDFNAARHLAPGQAFVLQNRGTGAVTVYDTKGLDAATLRARFEPGGGR